MNNKLPQSGSGPSKAVGTRDQLVQQLASGELDQAAFLEAYAHSRQQTPDHFVDLARQQRCGFPEAVFGEGKTVAQLHEIFQILLESNQPVLATRVSAEIASELDQRFPAGRYEPIARTYRIEIADPNLASSPPKLGRVAVVTAGTTDKAVASEALETLDWMGVASHSVADVGVAGPHRLPERMEELLNCNAIVVVAGMEGALPSVVGGYVACPIIAVPTSVGYGASLGGIAALLSMLNSCAANVAVVNIDAGFKAGYLAGMIAKQAVGT